MYNRSVLQDITRYTCTRELRLNLRTQHRFITILNFKGKVKKGTTKLGFKEYKHGK